MARVVYSAIRRRCKIQIPPCVDCRGVSKVFDSVSTFVLYFVLGVDGCVVYNIPMVRDIDTMVYDSTRYHSV